MRFIDYSGKSVRYVGNTTGISKDMRGLDISLSERISKFAVNQFFDILQNKNGQIFAPNITLILLFNQRKILRTNLLTYSLIIYLLPCEIICYFTCFIITQTDSDDSPRFVVILVMHNYCMTCVTLRVPLDHMIDFAVCCAPPKEIRENGRTGIVFSQAKVFSCLMR